jgi:hypothetical protein
MNYEITPPVKGWGLNIEKFCYTSDFFSQKYILCETHLVGNASRMWETIQPQGG